MSVAAEGTEEKAAVWRRLLRMSDWWAPKVGPAVAVGYCGALCFDVPGASMLRLVVVVAVVGFFAGSYGYILNDIFDLEIDRKAGKPNHMESLAAWQRVALCAVTLAGGMGTALEARVSARTLGALALEYMVLTVYSMPPIRLKSRGMLGLLCDASGSHVMANLFVLSTLADAGRNGAGLHSAHAWEFVAAVCAWELCLGLMGILLHQVEDRDNDLRAGIETFMTRRTFAAMRAPMTGIFALEVLAFACLCGLLSSEDPLLALAATAYAVLQGARLYARWEHFRSVQDDAVLMEWWQLPRPFYESWFPLATSVACATRYRPIWILVAVHALIAAGSWQRQRYAIVDGWNWLWLGARIQTDSGGRARVRPGLLPLPSRSIAITAPGRDPWSVTIARGGVRLKAGETYRVDLVVRSRRSRRVIVGVWQDHAPWDGCGFYQELGVGRGLCLMRRTFVAPKDEPHAFLGLWLGGETPTVQLIYWTVRRLEGAQGNQASKGTA